MGKCLHENALRQEDAVESQLLVAGLDGVHISRPASSTEGMKHRCRLQPAGGNTLRKLICREIGGLRGGRPAPRPDTTFCAEKFWRFRVQEKVYVHEDTRLRSWTEKSITKITAANEFIFAIGFSGFCIALHQTVNGSIALYKRSERIWNFDHPDEKVQNVFYNKTNDSVIIVSSTRHGYWMRALQLESIRTSGNLDSVPVLGFEAHNSPLFDDCNNIAVVSLAVNKHTRNVYELKSYKLVHSFNDEDISAIEIRPGKMIMVHHLIRDSILIEVWSTQTWTRLRHFNYNVHLGIELEFVGLCNENLLLKEKEEKLQVIDIWNHGNVTAIEHTEHATLFSSSSLNADNILLKFYNDMVVTCNCHGEQNVLLEDKKVVGNDSPYNSFCMYITRDKNFAALYSTKYTENPKEGIYNSRVPSIGSIYICNTVSGKIILEISPYDDIDLLVASPKDALQNVGVLLYDEERHRIITSDHNGYIHMWSN